MVDKNEECDLLENLYTDDLHNMSLGSDSDSSHGNDNNAYQNDDEYS